MGLLEHLGLIDAAAARPRGKCVRCGHTHDLANLANVMDAPYGQPAYMGTVLPQLVDVLVCAKGCPDPVGVHPALPARAGLRWYQWQGDCTGSTAGSDDGPGAL